MKPLVLMISQTWAVKSGQTLLGAINAACFRASLMMGTLYCRFLIRQPFVQVSPYFCGLAVSVSASPLSLCHSFITQWSQRFLLSDESQRLTSLFVCIGSWLHRPRSSLKRSSPSNKHSSTNKTPPSCYWPLWRQDRWSLWPGWWPQGHSSHQAADNVGGDAIVATWMGF